MLIFAATLEMIAGVGHILEADKCLMQSTLVRGSMTYIEWRDASLGRSTSRNSPGQIGFDKGGEHSTMARCAAELTAAGGCDP